MRWSVVAAVLFMSLPLAAAQEPEFGLEVDVFGAFPEDESWKELVTRHFRVVGTLDESRLRELAVDLETFRYRFSDWFPGVDDPVPVPTTVLIVPDRDPFRDLPVGGDFGPVTVFVPEASAAYIAARDADAALSPAVLLEYSRQLVPEATILVPLWLREGLAAYFSTFHVNRYPIGAHRLTKTGLRVDAYSDLLRARSRTLIPFEVFLGATASSAEYADPERRELFLAQSWGFVHYLLTMPDRGRGSRSRIPATLDFVGRLAGASSIGDAFGEAFGESLGSVVLDFRGYLRQSRTDWLHVIGGLSLDRDLRAGKMLSYGFDEYGTSLPPITIPFGFDSVLEEVGEVAIRPLPYGEALYHVGDLLLHLGRPGAAEPWLAESVARFPEFAPPRASLARLDLDRGRFDEAGERIEASLALDPLDCRTHSLGARLVRARVEAAGAGWSSEDGVEAERFLAGALGLCPGLEAAAAMRADLFLLGGGDGNAVVAALLDALRLAPGRDNLLLRLAAVLAGVGEEAAARGILDSITAVSPEPGVVEAAGLLASRLGSREVVRLGLQPADGRVAGAQGVEYARVEGARVLPLETVEGSRVEGLLTGLLCEDGLTILIEVGGEGRRFHTDAPGSVRFIAGGELITEGVICGSVSPVPVTVTYRPGDSEGVPGTPLVVEVR